MEVPSRGEVTAAVEVVCQRTQIIVILGWSSPLFISFSRKRAAEAIQNNRFKKMTVIRNRNRKIYNACFPSYQQETKLARRWSSNSGEGLLPTESHSLGVERWRRYGMYERFSAIFIELVAIQNDGRREAAMAHLLPPLKST